MTEFEVYVSVREKGKLLGGYANKEKIPVSAPFNAQKVRDDIEKSIEELNKKYAKL